MLFHPFEEQLHLPSAAVELGNYDGGQREVVGQENQLLPGGGIDIANAPQGVGMLLSREPPGQDDRLVETDAGPLSAETE